MATSMATLPIELINQILIFRPQHPTATLIKKATQELSRKISNYFVYIRILKIRKCDKLSIDNHSQKCLQLVKLRHIIIQNNRLPI